MREIKFRVWDRYCERMQYSNEKTGLVLGLDGKILSLILTLDRKPISTGQFFDYKDDFILMQYTGLKDKTGKEIYEGDILKSITGDKKEHFETVSFHKGSFCIEVVLPDSKNKKIYSTLGHHDYKGKLIAHEIVGNIYENPELLKKVI